MISTKVLHHFPKNRKSLVFESRRTRLSNFFLHFSLMEIAVKSCKNFEILFACQRIWQKENKEGAKLACTSLLNPIGLLLIIDFAQCASNSQNCFHYSITLVAIKDVGPHIY
jgi:hypothetical protein